MTAGPVAGAVLAGAGGTEAALLVDAASFAFVALAAVLLRARREPHPEAQGERARDGIVLLFRDRALAVVIGTVLVSLLFMSAVDRGRGRVREDRPRAQRSRLRRGVLLLDGRHGVRRGRRLAPRARGSPASRCSPWPSRAPASRCRPSGPCAGFAAAMFFAGGVGHGVKNVLVRALIQERVPDRFHGRAFAAYNGMRNGAELVALAWGGLLVVGARRARDARAGGLRSPCSPRSPAWSRSASGARNRSSSGVTAFRPGHISGAGDAAPVGAAVLLALAADRHRAPVARAVLRVVVEGPAADVALAGLQALPGALGDRRRGWRPRCGRARRRRRAAVGSKRVAGSSSTGTRPARRPASLTTSPAAGSWGSPAWADTSSRIASRSAIARAWSSSLTGVAGAEQLVLEQPRVQGGGVGEQVGAGLEVVRVDEQLDRRAAARARERGLQARSAVAP